jgi:hypothetical protein
MRRHPIPTIMADERDMPLADFGDIVGSLKGSARIQHRRFPPQPGRQHFFEEETTPVGSRDKDCLLISWRQRWRVPNRAANLSSSGPLKVFTPIYRILDCLVTTSTCSRAIYQILAGGSGGTLVFAFASL